MRDFKISIFFHEKIRWTRGIIKSGVIIVLLILSCIFIYNCENPITGYGPQPRYIDSFRFTPMLNILGVLRPDTLDGFPQSFVHLEKSYPFNEFPDSTIVTDARISIYKYEGIAIVDSVSLNYCNFNAHFLTWEYRDSTFFPEPGAFYGISCVREGFPDLKAMTCVPLAPVIDENSIKITNQELSFTIKRDSLVALYDIYFLVGSRVFENRIRRPEHGDVEVVLELERLAAENGELIVYGYDLNLSEYITYNISIKPNTYRVPYSTVENGYGCFGSLNVYKKTFRF